MHQFVMINNKRFEFVLKGKKGTPIVILTGMGCSFEEWYEVTESISDTNRVIMFHRPGLGESEVSERERNTIQTVEETNILLKLLEIEEPVLMVGHSYGGLCAQHFVKMYPQKVRGLVLVDSTSEDLEMLDMLDLPIINEESSDEEWIRKCMSYSLLTKEELRKIINPTLTKKQKLLRHDVQQHLIEFQLKPELYKTMKAEVENWKKDAQIIKRLGGINDIPLVVIGRDKDYNIEIGIEEGLPEWEIRLFEKTWQELIRKQCNLSQNSELIFAKQSTHSIYLDRPDILIEAINKVLI
ncbi:alpha/beta fold hydrolase [Psychrobacillus vulpis]|uniref:Alpha/beta hydrolase n=1 Tax=Psychrobacillus vulpis TaxID=2325572 RepID=A0A544TT53_9BACI|nr:alpha/beta hydrolase [Psychrobacillus vulpis]TQR20637.1 alpha/beta hydrolase [Psychrobacillus vulpis]